MEEREGGKSGEFRAFPLALIYMERTDIRTLETKQKFRCIKLEVKIFVTTFALFEN